MQLSQIDECCAHVGYLRAPIPHVPPQLSLSFNALRDSLYQSLVNLYIADYRPSPPIMASNLNLIKAAFDQAVRDFKAGLSDQALCEEISKISSIEAVYDATDAIQKERGQRGLLRNLKKIEPFLNGLRNYAAVIEVFVQSKQDVLSLIWGPVKLLLQWANTLTQSIDAIINTLADIGERLPEFQRAREMFQQNKHIENVLPLFFRDLLDLYLIALKFFRKKRKSIGCSIHN